jgi:tetratricopeptide (TPR) repeat protein
MDDRGKDAVRDLVVRGREHYVAREYDKAEACLSEVLRENVAYADVYDMMGVIYHQQGKLAEAEGMFQRALDINPAYTEAALNLAVTLNDLGKYREAKDVYQRALLASKNAPRSLDPFAKGKIANMHADTGAAYHAVGMYPDAVREYQHALALCPTFVDIRTRLGTTLREMGDTTEAVKEFERVRAENPRFITARLHLGLCYYAAGRKDDATAEWRAVLDIAPENKSAEMYLAMLDRA